MLLLVSLVVLLLVAVLPNWLPRSMAMRPPTTSALNKVSLTRKMSTPTCPRTIKIFWRIALLILNQVLLPLTMLDTRWSKTFNMVLCPILTTALSLDPTRSHLGITKHRSLTNQST